MSASTCSMKTSVQTSGSDNNLKTGHGTFNIHTGNLTSAYQLDSSESGSFETDSYTDQRRRNTLPAPHLLLHSNSEHMSSSASSGVVSRPNGQYSTITYSNSSINGSLTNREQIVDSKPSNFLNYSNSSRQGYNYMRTGLASPSFDSITETISFGNESLGYPVTENGFGGWTSHSLMHDLKGESVVEYRSQVISGSQQSNCTDGFSVLSPAGSGTSFANMNRCTTSCTARRVDENASHLGIHMPTRGHSQHQIQQYESMEYRNIGGRVYDTSSSNSSNLICTPTVNGDRSNCDVKTTSISSTRSSRSASTPTPSLNVAASSPVTSTVTMAPDSSTKGFMGNKFGCSSDDGEASPTPTCSSECPQTPGRARKPAPTLATGRRNLKGELVDPDEADRRMKRRERNRKSAQKCRERKVQRTQELQSQVECLQMEANRLMQELDGWRTRARQCVALLQHHCPGVSVPYLSCLNEPLPCLSSFKEPMDSLNDITSFDKNTEYEPLQTDWKLRHNDKSYTLNGISNEHNLSSNEHSSVLPPMNLLHSHIAPNRSKSLFGISVNGSEKESDVRQFSSIPESSNISCHVPEHNTSNNLMHNITRSTSAASMQGPGSGSSSSSCSTYELSFPLMENQARCLTDSSSFKEYTDSGSIPPTPAITGNRDRSRVLSGQDLLNASTQSAVTSKTLSMTNNGSNKHPPWNLEYQELDVKQPVECSPLSPLSSPLQNREYNIAIDSDTLNHCDSDTGVISRSNNQLEGACYS